MKRKILHSVAVWMSVFLLPFISAGCIEEYPPSTEQMETGMYLNISTIGHTRANTSDLSDNEKMNSLRVILLHPDGTVEHNIHYSLVSSDCDVKRILLKVKPAEHKKLFLFANEESVASVAADGLEGSPSLTDLFNSYTEGAAGFEEIVSTLHFEPDYSDGKPIPMSADYDIVIPEKGNYENSFYVVRVATKFTVNFVNMRDETVKVNGLSLSSHADRNFIMAHVSDSEQNRLLFGEGNTWIDWLKKITDNAATGDDAEETGWLKDYDLPDTSRTDLTFNYGSFNIGALRADPEDADNIIPGKAEITPVFYIPESKNPKAGATDGEQEYSLTIKFEGADEPFTNVLPNLKTLFRNTHVIVNITMYRKEILFKVTVEPWIEGGRTEIDVEEE